MGSNLIDERYKLMKESMPTTCIVKTEFDYPIPLDLDNKKNVFGNMVLLFISQKKNL